MWAVFFTFTYDYEIYLYLLPFFPSQLVMAQNDKDLAEMAKARVEKEDYKNALDLINRAITLNDTNQWYPIQKAEIEFKLYGPRDAIGVIFKALPLNRKKSEYYNRLGSYYQSSGMVDSAVYMFNIAIKYAANDTIKNIYLQNKGAAKIMNRNFEGAKQDFEKVLVFDPTEIATLNNIASVYDELGEKAKAIAIFKKIIQINPKFTGAYSNLGFCYTNLDSLDLAISYFNQAIHLDPKDALAYNNRGYVYYKQKKYPEALKDINYSVSLYPTNAYAYRNLALVYIATNKKSETCDTLKFAEYYGFEQQYGDEVKLLRTKHCK